MNINYNIVKNSLHRLKYSQNVRKELNGVVYELSSSSSCIINHPNHDDKYILIIRYINYQLDKYGNSKFLKKSIGKNSFNIITFNKIVVLDNFLNIEHEYFLNTIYERNTPYIGIEDVRFFNFKKEIYYLGSYYQNNKINIVSGVYNVGDPILSNRIITPSFDVDVNKSEKNWSFFNNNGDINVIYQWYPLYICKINYNTKKLDLIKIKNMPDYFKSVRGSTSGLEYNNNIWFIVHYCIDIMHKKNYIHIFAVFNKEMDLIGYSNPFKFRNCIVEYCIGMTLNNKNNFVITFSLLDKTTELCILKNSFVESLINYI
jgi:hypothetical protein